MPCAENTYKNVNGSGACMPCPSRSTSFAGSNACMCKDGFKRKDVMDVAQGCLIRIEDAATDTDGFRYSLNDHGYRSHSCVDLRALVRVD
jgi:hypothetical protein